jgi:tetratricopeptide (TPR) repeat protein
MTSFGNHFAHIAKLEAKFGPHSEEVAVALRTLARLICQYEEPAGAVPYFERCMAIREALKGPAAILPDLDEWIEQTNPVGFTVREPFILKRLSIKAGLFGEADPRVADACDALASDYVHLSRFAEARPLLERSLAIREKLGGVHGAEVASVLETLVAVCLREGQREQADRYLERCNEAAEAAFGANSSGLARMLVSLAVARIDADRSQKHRVRSETVRQARPLFERAFAINEELFGPDSLELQKALEAIARACLACGAFWEAEPLLERLLSIGERTYGHDAAALLWILAELAHGYADERSGQAEPLLERSFDVLRKFLDAKRPTFSEAIADLPGNSEVLYGGNPEGLLEKLVQASETTRRNLRKRWGASG